MERSSGSVGRLRVDDVVERSGSRGSRRGRAGRRAGMSASSAAAATSCREALVADERLRLGVLEDVRDLGRAEPVVDRHVVEAGLERGEVDGERVRAVGQHRRDGVALAAGRGARSACDELVGPGQHVAGRVLGAVGVDDREVARIVLRVLPESHRRAPSDWAASAAD